MQVACIWASWYCGGMVKLLGLAACFLNLKVGGSNPLLGNTSTMDVFSLRPAVAWYFARLFATKRWRAFIHQTKKFRIPNFLNFDVFRQTLKIPRENPAPGGHHYLPVSMGLGVISEFGANHQWWYVLSDKSIFLWFRRIRSMWVICFKWFAMLLYLIWSDLSSFVIYSNRLLVI